MEMTWFSREARTTDAVLDDPGDGEREGFVRAHVGEAARGLPDDQLRALVARARDALKEPWLMEAFINYDRRYVMAVLSAVDVLAADPRTVRALTDASRQASCAAAEAAEAASYAYRGALAAARALGVRTEEDEEDEVDDMPEPLVLRSRWSDERTWSAPEAR